MFNSNVQFSEVVKLSPWRKISLGSWRPVGDSSVYADVEFSAEPILNFLEQNKHLNLNHILCKCVALAIKEVPEINSVIRFGRIYRRKDVDVFFHILGPLAIDDLSGVKIDAADLRDFSSIRSQFNQAVKSIKDGGDPLFSETKAIFRFLPGFLSRWILDLTGFLAYELNLNLKILKVPKDAFGSVMVTNLGSLGYVDGGFTCIAPYTRIPLVIAVSGITQKPVVRDGQISIGTMIRFGMTFDHRLADGYHVFKFVKAFRRICSRPENWQVYL
jgi:pyruvate/2-oxoglutarate dehydrogenase complex dihydrolipoamide acyltransferase (E2) component